VLSGEDARGTDQLGFNGQLFSKRCLDVVIAVGALILSAPVLALAVLAIVTTSPGSPFYSQLRVGRNGRIFAMYKLRSMSCGSCSDNEPLLQKPKTDARVFPVGRFLRRTSIDELPNFINVLKGEMSVVGPRPMLDNEIRYCAQRHGAVAVSQRLAVKPGITGLWQISGRANLHFDERVKLDVEYAHGWSFRRDLAIMIKTIPALISSRGAY
jgi:lipopolysaccharide/colanic/teichoic acid biosynthesis glycosyltransferase